MANLICAICGLLSVLAVRVDALKFLTPNAGLVSTQSVTKALLFQLDDVEKQSRMKVFEDDLRPLFSAMPKNEHGLLEPAVVRHALHRYFNRKRSWHVSGLEPHAASLNASSPMHIMKGKVPAFIQDFLFERMHQRGLGLHELAAFVVVLGDLVHSEYTGNLQAVFEKLQMTTTVPFSGPEMAVIAESYVIHYFSLLNPDLAGNMNMSFAGMAQVLDDQIFSWQAMNEWARDLRHTLTHSKLSQRNPFKQNFAYSDAEEFADEFGYRFDSFQSRECHSLKEHLMEREYRGTGRVRLADFYHGQWEEKESEWDLIESEDFLRDLGALDESDPAHPSVIIPNFVGSRTNCLVSSSFYSVCCTDECEALLASLERAVESPEATPARIAGVIAALPSDTVEAPRNLSAPLLGRLDDIAALHGGQVPLQGRLFAQWMHHAYPRECRFPHVKGTTNPLSRAEWVEQFGESQADDEVMKAHAVHKLEKEDLTLSMSPEAKMEAMPWLDSEELVAGGHHRVGSRLSSWRLVGLVAFVATMIKLALTVDSITPAKTDTKQHMV